MAKVGLSGLKNSRCQICHFPTAPKFIGKGDVYYVILGQIQMQTMKKRLMLISFAMFMLAAGKSQSLQTGPANNSTTTAKQDVLQLKETAHNFGKIPQGRPATYNFEIVNT